MTDNKKKSDLKFKKFILPPEIQRPEYKSLHGYPYPEPPCPRTLEWQYERMAEDVHWSLACLSTCVAYMMNALGKKGENGKAVLPGKHQVRIFRDLERVHGYASSIQSELHSWMERHLPNEHEQWETTEPFDEVDNIPRYHLYYISRRNVYGKEEVYITETGDREFKDYNTASDALSRANYGRMEKDKFYLKTLLIPIVEKPKSAIREAFEDD